MRPDFVELFREAERRVRADYPALQAAAIVPLLLWYEPEPLQAVLDRCIALAGEGVGGLDLLYRPYDAEYDWTAAVSVAERASAAGLGITAHAGEFSCASFAAALRLPGLTRLGHAVWAARDERLLDLVARAGVTVECCLTSDAVLGAVASLEEHPIRRFIERNIPVALGIDDPVQLCTTIGREYALADALGFSAAELLGFTRSAVRAAFISQAGKAELLRRLDSGPTPRL